MGTRLYPIMKEGHTEADITLTPLKDVMLFEELEAEYKAGRIDTDQYYGTMYNNPAYKAAHDYSGFLLFGWGKFDPLECQREEGRYCSTSGELKDMDKVKSLFWLNDIEYDQFIDLIDGVYWG